MSDYKPEFFKVEDKGEVLNKKETDDENAVTIFEKPRSGCHHCYGRGFIGYENSEPKLCACLTNRFVIHKSLADTKNRLTRREFRDILAAARKAYNLKEPTNEQFIENTNRSSQGNIQEVSSSLSSQEPGSNN